MCCTVVYEQTSLKPTLGDTAVYVLESILDTHAVSGAGMGFLFSKPKKYWVPDHRRLNDLLDEQQQRWYCTTRGQGYMMSQYMMSCTQLHAVSGDRRKLLSRLILR